MRAYLVWLILSAFSAFALWQLYTREPSFTSLAMGLLLLILGGIAGLRWGADSAGQAIKEMALLNKYLAEQNRELAEMNHLLLKQAILEEEFSEERSSHAPPSEEA